jgi:UPF0755 protein
MWRNIASNAITLIVIGLFLIGGVMTLLKAEYYKTGPLTEAICLKVEPGSSMQKISVYLRDKGRGSKQRIVQYRSRLYR